MIGAAEGDPPTILIDEADTIFGHDAGAHEDLRGLLNAGHQRGRPALRWDINTRSVEELDTYAMAALAGIGRMPDTIEDRAVIIRMRRRAPTNTSSPTASAETPPPHQPQTPTPPLGRATTTELAHRNPTCPSKTEPPTPGKPSSPSPTSPAATGHQRPDKPPATSPTKPNNTNDGTIATQLLADCRTAFAGRRVIRTTELLAALNADPEAPWATHGHGTDSTPAALGPILKEFGIRARKFRIEGEPPPRLRHQRLQRRLEPLPRPYPLRSAASAASVPTPAQPCGRHRRHPPRAARRPVPPAPQQLTMEPTQLTTHRHHTQPHQPPHPPQVSTPANPLTREGDTCGACGASQGDERKDASIGPKHDRA